MFFQVSHINLKQAQAEEAPITGGRADSTKMSIGPFLSRTILGGNQFFIKPRERS